MSVHTVFPVVETQPLSKIGQLADDRKGLFDTLDAQAREIEKKWKATWLELADICTTVHASELWREGGYASFGSWVQSACPTSRSMAYAAMGIRKELKEIPTEELKQIPLGNAEILKNTPKQNRSGKVLKAAKEQPPREFLRTVILEAPNAHLERKQCHKFRMTATASKTLQGALDMWRMLNDDPDAPAEDALEGVISDYMLEHQAEFESKLAKA